MNTWLVPATSHAPRTGFSYLDAVLDQPGSVLAMAHRGGGKQPGIEGLENTMVAFRHAVDLGYDYLETDVHASADGVVYAFHDESLDRVTDSSGQLAELTSRQIARAKIGGREPIPPFEALLEEWPDARFNVDLKAAAAVPRLAELVERHAAHDRICVGSFSWRRLAEFRKLTQGRVATSAAPAEVAAFVLSPLPWLARMLTRHKVQALQVPPRQGPVPIVTRGFVDRAHAAGVQVHVWTIDSVPQMHELLDLGVDGLVSDRTDLLRDVLVSRGQWRDHR